MVRLALALLLLSACDPFEGIPSDGRTMDVGDVGVVQAGGEAREAKAPKLSPEPDYSMPPRAQPEQPHPSACEPGYIFAPVGDWGVVGCQHIDGQPYAINPCVKGGVVAGSIYRTVICG